MSGVSDTMMAAVRNKLRGQIGQTWAGDDDSGLEEGLRLELEENRRRVKLILLERDRIQSEEVWETESEEEEEAAVAVALSCKEEEEIRRTEEESNQEEETNQQIVPAVVVDEMKKKKDIIQKNMDSDDEAQEYEAWLLRDIARRNQSFVKRKQAAGIMQQQQPGKNHTDIFNTHAPTGEEGYMDKTILPKKMQNGRRRIRRRRTNWTSLLNEDEIYLSNPRSLELDGKLDPRKAAGVTDEQNSRFRNLARNVVGGGYGDETTAKDDEPRMKNKEDGTDHPDP